MTDLSAATVASVLDGTEKIPILQAAAFRGATTAQLVTLANTIVAGTTITATGTLPSGDLGKIVAATTAAITISLPSAAALADYTQAVVLNASAGSITVNGTAVQAGGIISHYVRSGAWVLGNKPYAAASGGSSVGDHPGLLTGSYTTPLNTTMTNGAAMPAGFMSVIPVRVPSGIYSSIGPLVINTASAAGLVKCALYAFNTGAFGGALVGEGAAVSTTTAGKIAPGAFSGGNKTLGGWYWAAALCDNATATFMAINNTSSWTLANGGSVVQADTFGTAPAMFSHFQLSRTYASGFPATLTAFNSGTDFRSTSAAQCVPLLLVA